MKKIIFISVFLIVINSTIYAGETGNPSTPSSLIIEDFSSATTGKFPKNWLARKENGEKIYLVREEDKNRYLHILDKGESVQIMKEFRWNSKEYRFLSWRWRVHQLPAGADETRRETNDSAAAIYVIFAREWFIPRVLKYVWSTTLKPGDTATAGKGTTKVKVLRGGKKNLGKWMTETVNVFDDFNKYFGHKPDEIIGVGVLTDANATHSTAEADYDDFIIKKSSTVTSTND